MYVELADFEWAGDLQGRCLRGNEGEFDRTMRRSHLLRGENERASGYVKGRFTDYSPK